MALKSNSGIYTVTNTITNQIYVGYASNLHKRLGNHRRDLLLNKHDNKLLQESYNNFGVENFKFEILEFHEKEFLTSMEHYWCQLLNTHNITYGFNIQKTNPNAICLSLLPKHLSRLKKVEYIKVIKTIKPKKSRKGIKFSEKAKLNMSNAKKGKPMHENCRKALLLANTNRKMSKEHKAKLLSLNLGKKQSVETITKRKNSMSCNDKTKIVLQYSLDNDLIKEWKSSSEIERTLNFGHQSISRCCLGQRKTAFNFIWKYKNE